MDFGKLDPIDRENFLSDYNFDNIPFNSVNRFNRAQELFDYNSTKGLNLSYPVVDLYIASKYLENGGPTEPKYEDVDAPNDLKKNVATLNNFLVNYTKLDLDLDEERIFRILEYIGVVNSLKLPTFCTGISDLRAKPGRRKLSEVEPGDFVKHKNLGGIVIDDRDDDNYPLVYDLNDKVFGRGLTELSRVEFSDPLYSPLENLRERINDQLIKVQKLKSGDPITYKDRGEIKNGVVSRSDRFIIYLEDRTCIIFNQVLS